MIEVVLVSNQRFFVDADEVTVRKAIFECTMLDGYTTSQPGEESKTWSINAAAITAFQVVGG